MKRAPARYRSCSARPPPPPPALQRRTARPRPDKPHIHPSRLRKLAPVGAGGAVAPPTGNQISRIDAGGYIDRQPVPAIDAPPARCENAIWRAHARPRPRFKSFRRLRRLIRAFA